MNFFLKNETTLFPSGNKAVRLGGISPATKTGEVVTYEQAVLITPTETVTQGTSITTGVTLSAKKGLITTFTPSTAGLAATTFTVTNTLVTASSNIEAYVAAYGGTVITNGLPYAFVKSKTTGSFNIVIYNAHATNALSTSLVIGFEIKD
jgi:hypothetical protein